jgi:hypothetical protein
MADPFANSVDTPALSSRAPFAVTPHDSTILPTIPEALYVGTGGNIVLRGVDGTADVTFQNVPAGAVLDVRASHVRATGTTAGAIIGLA